MKRAIKRLSEKPMYLIVGGVVVLLLIVVGVLGFKYIQATKNKSDSNNQATTKRVIKEVGQLYILPTNEQPTVALIQDKSKLGNQSFFKNSQNGDYLLVYKTNRVALVYREKVDKLVTVGPVNFDAATDSNQTGSTTTPSSPKQ